MKLRARLAITTVLAAAPVMVAVLWLDARVRAQAATDLLSRVTLVHMLSDGGREACEANPAAWGGVPIPPPRGDPMAASVPPPPRDPDAAGPHPPAHHAGESPPVLFAYDAALKPTNPAAPAITDPWSEPLWPGSVVHALVKMPWTTGPCAVVLARGSVNPSWLGAPLPQRALLALPVLAALIAILLFGGSLVLRIGRLTRAVARSAGAGFHSNIPVEGSDEVAELARAFATAHGAARVELAARRDRERILREFVANTNHDVTIPLTVLKAHLSTLKTQLDAGEPIDASTLVHAMNEAHYLGALIQNLAVHSKLDAAQMTLARVDLGELVERVLARHRPIARELGVSLDGAVPDNPLAIHGDTTLLEQAVNNLVYNALRYNERGGHVGLVLDRLGHDRFRIRVVDDGPGIAPDELRRITERGERGDGARTRAPGGEGIGLSIAVRVAHAHHLTLTLVSGEEGGLTVDLVGRVSTDVDHDASEA